MKFRKLKTETFEAMRLTEGNYGEFIGWLYQFPAAWNTIGICKRDDHPYRLAATFEVNIDKHPVRLGDWVIVGDDCVFRICKPDIFEATYEPVEE